MIYINAITLLYIINFFIKKTRGKEYKNKKIPFFAIKKRAIDPHLAKNYPAEKRKYQYE